MVGVDSILSFDVSNLPQLYTTNPRVCDSCWRWKGFGIMTSKQMLIQGLGGQYLMISGSCLYIKSRILDSFYAMPNGLRWNGTIVALRIPYQSDTFNYINYIE